MFKRPILILDGMSCFVRYFMANEAMNASGEPIGGITGFICNLGYLINQFKPTQVFICWEQGGPSIRKKQIFEGYKANRAKNSDFKDLYKQSGKINPDAIPGNKLEQLQILSKALSCLPVCQLYIQDVEADDVVAYLVKNQFITKEQPKIIVSTDKDFYQLLEDKTVLIYDMAKKNFVTHDDVTTRFNILPKHITLARTLAGDASDNLDGVPGIGLKTVAKRFPFLEEKIDYDLDWILDYSRLESVKPKSPKCFQDILTFENIIRRNWKLMYLSSGGLSANQISKIQGRVTSFVPVCNKLNYIKVFTGNNIAVSHQLEQVSTDLLYIVAEYKSELNQ